MKTYILAFVFFMIGYSIAYYYKSYQFESFRLKLEQENSKLINNALDKVQELEIEKDKLSVRANNEISVINDKYHALLSKYNKLHNNSKSGAIKQKNNNTTRADDKKQYSSSRAYRDGFREIINVARDCAILESKFNRLQDTIRLYQDESR